MNKMETRTMPIAEAVSYALGEIQSLAEETREVVDGASGTPRESTQRIQTLDETASTLEGLEEPSIDEAIIMEVTFSEALPRSRRKGLSRASRRDNATSALDAAIQALTDADNENYQELIDDLERIKDEADGVEFPGMFG